eukprot:14305761-Ditylum_brightwellii.AAC.1
MTYTTGPLLGTRRQASHNVPQGSLIARKVNIGKQLEKGIEENWCKHKDQQDETNIKKYDNMERISTERIKDE